ncbi:diphthine methyltransferase-like [Mytilus trossulus]|uniref:diphthine methyltransferase-like n=1 Tax=Mytilus trossulus TaxID=6551 RepID=UPI003006755F
MAKTLQVLDTEYSADSVEWCPHDGYQDILLCGTYQLDQSKDSQEDSSVPQTRLGKLHTYRLKEEEETQSLDHVQTTDMPGILDIKWCPSLIDNQSLFGLVNSIGELQIYQLNDDGKSVFVTSTELGTEVLGLSLDWANRVHNSSDPEISCSSSDGNISICKFHQGQLKCTSNWKAHDFEAWITAFNYWNTNIVYSGGDDCKFKGWDCRQDTSSPIFVSKRHSMGVCSIQCHPFKENVLSTGSYDENLFIWDTRNMRSPIAETNLRGGVWRIKWDSQKSDYIITATMYNGFHVVDASEFSDGKLSVVCHYDKQESIGYGADICYKHSVDSERHDTMMGDNSTINFNRTIATCSFYNHVLHLWNFSTSETSQNKENKD